eukprot:g30858.t1
MFGGKRLVAGADVQHLGAPTGARAEPSCLIPFKLSNWILKVARDDFLLLQQDLAKVAWDDVECVDRCEELVPYVLSHSLQHEDFLKLPKAERQAKVKILTQRILSGGETGAPSGDEEESPGQLRMAEALSWKTLWPVCCSAFLDTS